MNGPRRQSSKYLVLKGVSGVHKARLMKRVGLGVVAIIPAAGKSTRFGHRDKLLANLIDKPVIVHTIQALGATALVQEIVLVVNREWQDLYTEIVERSCVGLAVKVTTGGETRQASVHRGLRVVGNDGDLVLIHDGARPLVTSNCIERVVNAARKYGAASAGIHPCDIVKLDDGNGFVTATVSRDRAWLAQTPQAFRIEVLKRAHEAALQASFEAEDDAALVERMGCRVKIVSGDERNMKLTTPYDLQIIERFLLGVK